MIAIACVAAPVGVDAQLSANSCGQVLEDDAVLAGDLDCTGFPVALTVRKARLDLAGFAVTGAPIICVRSCVVAGPGTTSGVTDDYARSGSYPASIAVDSVTVDGNVGWAKKINVATSTVRGSISGKRAVVSSSTVSDSPSHGIYATKLTVTDSIVHNNARQGIVCHGRALVEHSDISDNGLAGIDCFFRKKSKTSNNFRDVGRLEIVDSSVDRNGLTGTPPSDGIVCARRAMLDGTSVRDNQRYGIYVRGERRSGPNSGQSKITGTASVANSTVSGNIGGVYAETRATVLGTSVNANLHFGVLAWHETLLDGSAVVGNDADPACISTQTCSDVITNERAPVLRNGATCGTSRNINGVTWGVCSLD